MIEALDLVITISNVTAHLAAALGKPVWLLLAKRPLWYWGNAGEEVFFLSVHHSRTPGNSGVLGPGH